MNPIHESPNPKIVPPYLPPVTVLIDVEETEPLGNTRITTSSLTYVGNVVLWDEEKQRESFRRTWESTGKNGRLVAFHIPVTTYKRVEM